MQHGTYFGKPTPCVSLTKGLIALSSLPMVSHGIRQDLNSPGAEPRMHLFCTMHISCMMCDTDLSELFVAQAVYMF